MYKNNLMSHYIHKSTSQSVCFLQKLVNSVSKHKSELKHTFELQRLEQTELDNLKSQHALRLADLEKTQRELIDVGAS